MSDVETQAGDIRVAIGRYAREHDSVDRDELVSEVATRQGVSVDTVDRQVDLLEKEGQIYIAGGEVRVP